MTTGKDPHPQSVASSADSNAASHPSNAWVDRHLENVYAYAYRLAGSHDDAEELTQQTFLIAQQHYRQLRDPTRAEAWLFRILRNHFLKSRQRKRPLVASQHGVLVDQIEQPCHDFNDVDQDQQIQRALASLSDDFRTVVLMFYFEQLSYRQIAKELGLPMGTVMSRLTRARRKLRDVILRMERVAESVMS